MLCLNLFTLHRSGITQLKKKRKKTARDHLAMGSQQLYQQYCKTTPFFKPGLHYDPNYTPVKFPNCFCGSLSTTGVSSTTFFSDYTHKHTHRDSHTEAIPSTVLQLVKMLWFFWLSQTEEPTQPPTPLCHLLYIHLHCINLLFSQFLSWCTSINVYYEFYITYKIQTVILISQIQC